MALSVQNLRAGTIFQEDGRIYTVLGYHHHKMGRAKAVIKVKVRDVETDNVRELTFNNNATVQDVDVMRKNLEFVYRNERKSEVVFSDTETKERITVGYEILSEEDSKYLTGGTVVQAMLDESNDILTIELPNTVILTVDQTGPSDKGDTQGSARKPATLETGLIVHVPMFIKIGDTIKINTQTNEYMERMS